MKGAAKIQINVPFYPYALECDGCRRIFAVIPLWWTEEKGWKWKHSSEAIWCPFCGATKIIAANPDGEEQP